MATTSTQQTNGANTLIVSSSLPLSIPLSSQLSSTSQLSSAVNTSALAGSQPSLIAANHIQSPFGIQLYPHEFQQQVQLFQQQQQMFLQPQHGLSLQQNLIQTANEQHLNQALVKKKSNKQQKIVSKSSNQLPKSSNNQQLPTVLKSNMITGQPQFTAQNNQAVIINQLPNVQQALANKKILEQHKSKYVIQNNQITQQQIVSPQFKHQLQNNTHLQLTSQSPLINQAQLIAQPIQQPQLTWASNHVQRPIIIGQPTHAGAEGQQLFIQNPGALQAMQGGQFYVNQNQGALMQLVSNPQGNLNSVTAQLAAAQSNSTPSTPTNLATVTPQQTKQLNNSSSTSKLKSIRPASSLQNSSTTNSQQILSKTSKPIVSNKLQQQCAGEDSQKKLGKKQQQQAEQERFKKSTQQMNNELILSKNNLQRSESLKSLDSTKSKSEGKLKKQQSSSLDDDSSSLSSNSKLNNSINKKDKSEKKIKQKAIVKPIISHYVGGYIIHESSHPFPINITEELNDELEQIKLNNGADKNQIENNGIKEGKTKLKKVKKSKSKLSNISNNPMPSTSNINMKNESKQVEPQNKKNLEIPPAPINNEEDVIIINSNNNNSSDSSDSSSLDERNVLHWSVEQVYEYLKNHGTSIATAEELKKEKINGRSLVLLTLPMLTKDKFAFKLGPSLSLKKIIDELKGKASEDKIENYLPSSGNSNINDWSVKDTKEFILNLSSEKHADEFEKQEIDGKSLNLISYDNIINDLNLEFGPALVIYSKIEELKTLSNK